MEEVRKKDVLRLFFGREHKHYLVQKVAKHYLKLKSEEGLILRLFHSDGKLEKINDAKITGFEILHDPTRYAMYKIGTEVSVRTFDGKSFKGDITENDDGLLRIKTDKNDWYVDLDNNANKIDIVGNSVLDEHEVVQYSDEIDDLFFLNKDKDISYRRLYEYHRTQTQEQEILPFWIVPVLDNNKCRLDLVGEKGSFRGDPLRVFYSTSGKKIEKRTEAVLFNQTVFNDRIKDVYVVVNIPEKEDTVKLPVVEYAVMLPLQNHFSLNNINPLYAVRLSQPKENDKRFDNIEDALTSYIPNLTTAGSLFDAEVQLFPLRLKPNSFKPLVFNPKLNLKNIAPPEIRPKNKRLSLSAAYKSTIPDELSTSESLLRMFTIDYANTYFNKQPVLLVTQDKNWALEKIVQRMKNNNVPLYAKEAIGIINSLYLFYRQGRYVDFLRMLQQHGRPADGKENKYYIYFSTPVFSKYKMIPCSLELIVRIMYLRGSTGVPTFLESFTKEDGMLVDRDTGYIFSYEQDLVRPCETKNDDIDCFLQTVPTYSENDLILLNLANRMANELNLRISKDNEIHLLDAARLNGQEPYKAACGIAAYLAFYSHISYPIVAEVLRKVAKRKIWASVHDSKELTADITKTAAKLIVPKRKKNKITSEEVAKKSNSTREIIPPKFEHILPSTRPKKAAVAIEYTVLSEVKVKEYSYVSDVFAPDSTPVAVLMRCMPIIMTFLAPTEKSLFDLLGEAPLHFLYEFVSNLACVIPTLLITGRPGFEENIIPSKKKISLAFKTVWTQYYSVFLTISTNDENKARFESFYKPKAATFQRLSSVAKKALFKEDVIMLQACAVRAVYMYFDNTISEELESFILSVVRACIAMYRKHKKLTLSL